MFHSPQEWQDLQERFRVSWMSLMCLILVAAGIATGIAAIVFSFKERLGR